MKNATIRQESNDPQDSSGDGAQPPGGPVNEKKGGTPEPGEPVNE